MPINGVGVYICYPNVDIAATIQKTLSELIDVCDKSKQPCTERNSDTPSTGATFVLHLLGNQLYRDLHLERLHACNLSAAPTTSWFPVHNENSDEW